MYHHHKESQNYKEFGWSTNLGRESATFSIIAIVNKLMRQIPFAVIFSECIL